MFIIWPAGGTTWTAAESAKIARLASTRQAVCRIQVAMHASKAKSRDGTSPAATCGTDVLKKFLRSNEKAQREKIC